MYVSGYSTQAIYQYSLSTAYDLSTASYDSVSFSVSSQATGGSGLAFNNDGTKLYVVGYTEDSVFEYVLSTAFDLSTASYNSVSFSVLSQDSEPYQMSFNDDGTKMFVVGNSTDSVYQYSLSTAFDLSTASYDSVSFSVTSQEASPYAFTFGADGTKMYVVGATNDTVYQYTTGTYTSYTITYDNDTQWSGGSAPTSPDANETDVLTFTTSDGGTTYQAVQAIDGAS